MREEESNWFPRWDEELPSPEELMPLSQTLITPDLAMAFDIRNPNPNPSLTQTQSPIPNNPPNLAPPPPATATMPLQAPPSSSDFGDSADLNSAGNTAGDEPARTLKRPRLVWTPQLHKRFVDAVAHLGIKNAVPKTIMQLMSVDGLTRENVASHLQKYRLYLKRMQGLSSGGGGSGGGVTGSDPATDHLFASSPVPAHFLHPAAAATSARPGSEQHYLPFVPVAALHPHQHHHHQHQQHHHQIAAIQGQFQHHRQQQQQQHFEHPFLARPVHHRIGVGAGSYGAAEDLDPISGGGGGGGGRKVLTLFPTGED